MKTAHPIDEARLGIMLNELRLPTIKTLWPRFAETADREGWPAARFLAAIAEHELAERANRRVERHLGSRLIDLHSQNMTVAARATAERKVLAHRS